MFRKLLIVLLITPVFLLAAPTPSAQDCYSALITANEKQQWQQVILESEKILKIYAQSPFAQEATFYLAVGYFNLGDYDWANRYFSEYLKQQATPKHFEETIEYKFAIAEKFKEGAKRHLFSVKNLPQWMPARSDALSIYDEVIAALPHQELAAKALYSKAQLLLVEEDFLSSLETYQTLIRRFPKHALAAESYIGICQVYLTQSQTEYPDPDFLDLAEINLRKFRMNFPSEEKIAIAEEILAKMQEYYAQHLFEIGRFFERTKKYSAAIIYYSKILLSFPTTHTAAQSEERLAIAKAKLAKQPG